ncbi:hypothetical protein PYW07_006639 [Mythimna separata]|uniref:Uncharacterized protein n=1 Tax=Mythimna separata TaxID=271217 RepID=A0AAD8DWY2_MYTSE|nr:hypothetical protein PYW07_006639 [Mythimna separata]
METPQNLPRRGKTLFSLLQLQEYGFEHIKNAYVQGLRALREYTEAHLVEELRTADTQKKLDISSKWNDSDQMKILSDTETLSAFIDLDLTKAQYMYLKNLTNDRKCCIFPPYYKIQEIKRSCYPPSCTIEITNTYAKVINIHD